MEVATTGEAKAGPTAAVLGALEAIERAGGEVTRRAILEASGLTRKSLSRTLVRLRRSGKVARHLPSGVRGKYHALLEAAPAILGRGEALTREALAAEVGWTPRAVGAGVRSLRMSGRWPHAMRPAARPSPARSDVARDQEAMLLALAATLADADFRLRRRDLLERSGLPKTVLDTRLRTLRTRGRWPYGHTIDRPARSEMPDEVDLGIRERAREIFEGHLRPMGDGRAERDSPGSPAPPRSGRDHSRRVPTAADVCREMLDNWRASRRRRGPAPASAPRAVEGGAP